MTWENYGTYWTIDHMVPISTGKNEEEIFKLNHFSNLKPLLTEENIAKGAKHG